MKKAYSFEEDLQKATEFDVLLLLGFTSPISALPSGAFLAYLDKASPFRPIVWLYILFLYFPFWFALNQRKFVTPWKAWSDLTKQFSSCAFIMVKAKDLQGVISESQKAVDMIQSISPSKYIIYDENQTDASLRKVLVKVNIYNSLKNEESLLPTMGIFSRASA
jgi:hypothetical protein